MPATSTRSNVILLSGLFVLSFSGLLWLTADEHTGRMTSDSATLDSVIAPTLNIPAATSSAHLLSDDLAVTSPIATDEAAAAEQPQLLADEVTSDVSIADTATLPTANVEPLQSSGDATRVLQGHHEQRTRLAALNALLLRGCQSSVDPAITKALEAATSDADPVIAAQANSAFAETRRATH